MAASTATLAPFVLFETRPSVRSEQFALLAAAAAKYGFDPIPNELPTDDEGTPESQLREHLAHLNLANTVLDPARVPASRLDESPRRGGIPLAVRAADGYAEVERCIMCGSTDKGPGYTICAGCYTLNLRVAERNLLEILPDCNEAVLSTVKPFTHDEFRRGIRRSKRLQPTRFARHDPRAETAFRAARARLAAARRDAVLEELRNGVDQATTPSALRRAEARLHAAEEAAPFCAGAWERGLARMSLVDHWLEMASVEEAEMALEADDSYPVEYGDEDWLDAPDLIHRVTESHAARSNDAIDTVEHEDAIYEEALRRSLASAERRAEYDPELAPYASMLRLALLSRGAVTTGRASRVRQYDDEECARWDRWVDHILGGEYAPVPPGIGGYVAASAMLWGEALSTSADGIRRTPVLLERIDRGLPSGRLRWPQFVTQEIEEQLCVYGRWFVLPADEMDVQVRMWADPDPMPARRRRLDPRKVQAYRLERWASQGAKPPVAALAPRPKGSRGAWEREIRLDNQRRRFEHFARASAGVHPTRLERGQAQAI